MPVKPVAEVATEFRQRLDLLFAEQRDQLPEIFRGFPDACCEFVSILLADHLVKCGFESPLLVTAEWHSGKFLLSHVWLELDDQVIDITGDQAGIDLHPVIVSATSDWHRDHPAHSKRPYKEVWAECNGWTQGEIDKLYRALAG